MRSTIALTPFVPWLIALASCSSPPQPPHVDDSHRRPVNAQTTVELQACRNELHNTRLTAVESSRLAETTATTLANMVARQRLVAATQTSAGQQPKANRVFTVRFDFGSAHVAIPPDIAAALVEDAKASPLVLLRGRTDGIGDSPVESRMARARAAAVRDYLTSAGVDPARIRATYQPTGDHAADNTSPAGRELNRRVEIEFYRALPVALDPALLSQP